MSELSIQAERVGISVQKFRDPHDFDVLLIETEDRCGKTDLIKVFLDGEHRDRLMRAVAAFNEMWRVGVAVEIATE